MGVRRPRHGSQLVPGVRLWEQSRRDGGRVHVAVAHRGHRRAHQHQTGGSAWPMLAHWRMLGHRSEEATVATVVASVGGLQLAVVVISPASATSAARAGQPFEESANPYRGQHASEGCQRGLGWQRHITCENLVLQSTCSRSYDIDLAACIFYFITIEQKWTLYERCQSRS